MIRTALCKDQPVVLIEVKDRERADTGGHVGEKNSGEKKATLFNVGSLITL